MATCRLQVALEQLDRHPFGRADEADAHARANRGRLARELDPLGLELGGDGVDAGDGEAEMIEALIGRAGGGLTPSPGVTGAMKMLAPPSLRSMRGWPCCMLRITSAPSMRSYHWAVPSGLVVRK